VRMRGDGKNSRICFKVNYMRGKRREGRGNANESRVIAWRYSSRGTKRKGM